MGDIEDAIGRVSLFEKLSPRDRRRLAGSMHERTFSVGTVITQVGQEGVAFFIIDSGTASVEVAGRYRREVLRVDGLGVQTFRPIAP
jgi:hypothetical protein